jgi:serine/threonine protein kinase/Tol biopolymer transport system component
MNQPPSVSILGPDEFRKIRKVFESAIELAPAERARFVEESCDGDPRLIAEVQRMLSGDADGNALLDGCATGQFQEGATFAEHLRIGTLLGRGGMGEVYRAHDIHLRRDVALKVLPSTFALNADRVGRLKREAQVLASLNHPNIAGIYGLEESDGVYALELELVEGPTLADRLTRGPIAIDEALSIARQIAVALQAAHEKGVVHRDLKPANLNAPEEGPLKVLDFGLAKPNDEPMSADKGILGTAAYMSPEQALGKTVDKRTDIWAFGCVLFEMLTGTRAFAGPDIKGTLESVLQSQPSFENLPSSVPPAIRTLLQRCLEKDRTRRVADAATLVYVLDQTASLAPPVAVRKRDQRWIIAAVAAGILACGFLLWSRWPSPARPPIVRFAISKFDGQLMTMGRMHIAVSPDGSRLVYHSNGRAFLRELSESDARPRLTSGTLVSQTTLSPDGRSLAAWFGEYGGIKRMEISGGALVPVCRADNVFGMTWDQSGILIGQGAKGIIRCAANGRGPEQLATVEAGEEADGPQILPGGNSLLFTIAKTAEGPSRWDTARVVVQSLESGERKTVLDGGSAARYIPTGHLLYVRSGTMFAVPFDVSRGRVIGQAVALVRGVRRTAEGFTGGAQFAVSNNGHLFYIPGPVNSGTSAQTIAVADRAGVVTRFAIPPGPYVYTRASRDGTRLAVGTDDEKEAVVWICRLSEKSALQRLTIEGRNRYPIWSPDGTRVAYQSDRGGEHAIYMQRVNGIGRPQRLAGAQNGASLIPESWSPDGRLILISQEKGSEFSLWTLSVQDGTLRPLEVKSARMIGATFSPDGRWIAYSVSAGNDRALVSPDRGVFVQPFPLTGAIYQAPKVLIDFHPVWSPSGRELMYIAATALSQLATVRVTAQDGLTFGEPVKSPFRINANHINTQARAYDVLPDGRFVGLIDASEPEGSPANSASEIRVVLNWFEELKARVQPGER